MSQKIILFKLFFKIENITEKYPDDKVIQRLFERNPGFFECINANLIEKQFNNLYECVV